MRNDVNGKQVAGGCFMMILAFITVFLDIPGFLKFIFMAVFILFGLVITNAFD